MSATQDPYIPLIEAYKNAKKALGFIDRPGITIGALLESEGKTYEITVKEVTEEN